MIVKRGEAIRRITGKPSAKVSGGTLTARAPTMRSTGLGQTMVPVPATASLTTVLSKSSGRNANLSSVKLVALMATYEATVTRGERYWVIYVPAIDRYTQARHLRELDAILAT